MTDKKKFYIPVKILLSTTSRYSSCIVCLRFCNEWWTMWFQVLNLIGQRKWREQGHLHLEIVHSFFQLLLQCTAIEVHLLLDYFCIGIINARGSYMVMDILDRSTLVPFPHPGFCLFSRFCKPKRRIMSSGEQRVKWITRCKTWSGLMSIRFCPSVPASLSRCVRSSVLHRCPSPCAPLSLEEEDELFQMSVFKFRNADTSLCVSKWSCTLHLSLQKPWWLIWIPH